MNVEENMKKQLFIILIISLAMMISCTGCENEIGDTIDLSGDTEILTSYRWVKDSDGANSPYLAFIAISIPNSETGFSMSIYEDEGQFSSRMGLIRLQEDRSMVALFDGESYSVRISSTQDGVITLSLTDQEDSETILYFSPEPLIQ